MRVSLAVTNFSFPGGSPRLAADLADVARRADEGGLDTIWVSDHLMQGEPGTDPTEPMLEAYATLGYLAAVTRRLRLGTMVTAVASRVPSLLVKAVTTLDVLSGGRAWLGVGAGYHQAEAAMMGLPMPPTAERFEHLEDTLRLATGMWTDDERPFAGTHHAASRPLCRPAPITRPHPPILVAGTGPTKTLRLVARYGQACNLPDMPDGGETIRRSLAVLAEHCATVGRPVDEIETTVSTRMGPGEDPEGFARRCAALGAIGVDHVVVLTSGAWRPDTVDALVAAARLTAAVTDR